MQAQISAGHGALYIGVWSQIGVLGFLDYPLDKNNKIGTSLQESRLQKYMEVAC